MKQRIICWLSLLICLLTHLPRSYAQITPDTVLGPDTVCVQSSGTYSVTPTPGHHYVWVVSGHGTITGPNNATMVTVLWGMVPSGILRVYSYDSANVLTDTGSIVVSIQPLPAPFITENVRVGCQQLTDTSSGDVHRPPNIIDDSHGCIKVCAGSIVTYTGWGAATDTFGWQIVGGSILAMGGDTCQVQWDTAGSGSVTVFDTSVYGCIGMKKVCIDIIPKPKAKFALMPPGTGVVCLDESLVFVDHSVDGGGSPIISWIWNFEDGTIIPMSGPSPVTHMFTHPGVYNVTLTISNACGCVDSFKLKITVLNKTGVNIECPGVVCQGAIETYSLSPTVPCSSYMWHAIGGTILSVPGPTVKVQWNSVDTTGFGYLEFNAAPCTVACGGITTIKIPVIQTHGHISGPKTVCVGGEYLYGMPQWPTTVFNWTISGSATGTLAHNDQNNQIVFYPLSAGILYLRCDYNNTLLGCGGYAIDTITVLPPDSILGEAKVCLNTTTPYTLGGVSSIIGDWTIVYPDGITSYTGSGHSYTPPILNEVGTYILTVAPDPLSHPSFCTIPPFLITVDTLPSAPDGILGPDTVCYGEPFAYTAYFPRAGDVFEWAIATGSLNFIDGNTTEATFSGPGPDFISVRRATVSSPHCYSPYTTMEVWRPYVHPHITGADTVCPSTEYAYDAGYYFGESYTWTVIGSGMGSVKTNDGATAGILWNATGGPARVAVAVRKCDSVYTDTMDVWVRTIPSSFTITLAPDTICRGTSTTVTASIPGIIAWSWGDGSTILSSDTSASSVTHTYTTLSGSNLVDTITGISLNPWGCPVTITSTATVVILPAPVAFITPEGPFDYCSGSPSVTLTATLQAGYEPTDSLFWLWTTSSIPLHYCGTPGLPCSTETYINWGVYYVIAKGSNGCYDTSNYVTVDSVDCSGGGACVLSPNPTVSVSGVNNCGIVSLTGSYSSSPTYITSWWHYPVSALGVVTTPTTMSCNFADAGLYNFTYFVEFTDGTNTCVRTATTSILVPLVAYMGDIIGCAPGGAGYNVTMLDHSNYYPGHEPYKYSWYVDGGYVTTTTANSYMVLLAPGPHVIGEWVYYGPGLTDSCWVSMTINLDPLPIAGFSFSLDTTCARDTSVAFTNLSTGGTLTSAWDFGDGTGNGETNPYKTYDVGGVYTVTLTVRNAEGCTASDTAIVPIVDQDLHGVLSGDTTACSGNAVVLTYTPDGGTATPEQYAWFDDDAYMYYTLTNTTSVYTSGGYYVYVRNHYGCHYTSNVIPVNFIQIPPAIIDGGGDQCVGTPFTLDGWAGDGPGISYQWFKDGTLVGSSDSYTDPATMTGTFGYQLVLTVPLLPSGTCSDTSAVDSITIHALPTAPGTSFTMLDCNTYTVELDAIGPSYGTYLWSNADEGQVVDVLGAGGPYRVWYTDTFGCTSYSDMYVPKDPRLYMWVFPTGCYGQYCYGDTLDIIGPIQTFNYWAYQHAPLGPVMLDGYYSSVGTLQITASGSYDMILDNGLCRDTSGDMSVVFGPCKSCDTRQFGLSTYSAPCAPNQPAGDTCCNTFIVLNFPDVDGYTLFGTVTVTGGSISPGGVVLNPGPNIDTFQFFPDPGAPCQWVHFTLTYLDASGAMHDCSDSVFICPCNQNASGGGHHRSNPAIVTTQSDDYTNLNLVPNPAQNTVRVDYTTVAAGAAIEVYDMTGRLMNTYTTPAVSGSWQLPLDNYAAGYYLVTIRENGRVMRQSKLSVLR